MGIVSRRDFNAYHLFRTSIAIGTVRSHLCERVIEHQPSDAQ